MVDGNAGKGDRYRKVDQEKYDRNYIRIYGVECPQCVGAGIFAGKECPTCKGLGKIEKRGQW